MFTLIRLNLVVTVDTEDKRDKLIAAGYKLIEENNPVEPEKGKAPAKE